MGRQLRTTVAVTNPDSGALVWLAPGDELPDWAEDAVTNPKAWEEPADEPDLPGVGDVGEPRQVEAEPDAPEAEPADEDDGDEPSADAGYASWPVAMLRGEIQSRNTTRDAGDRIPVEGGKSVLVAALQADDE